MPSSLSAQGPSLSIPDRDAFQLQLTPFNSTPQILGGGLVRTIDDMFEIDSVNRVGWSDRCNPGTGRCEIVSETAVRVYLLVPRWFPFTVKATERTGNFVVGAVVNQVVPRFLSQLKTCLLYTSPSPRDLSTSRMPSSA